LSRNPGGWPGTGAAAQVDRALMVVDERRVGAPSEAAQLANGVVAQLLIPPGFAGVPVHI